MQHFGSDRVINKFSPDVPAVGTVNLNEQFSLSTQDCYAGQLSSESSLRPHIDMTRFNLATGPVEVTGVDPGDWVRVSIDEIEVNGYGVMALSPGLGVLGERISEPSTRLLGISDGKAWLTEAIGIPVRPMVGVLGVATATDSIPTAIPGIHGGNLDTHLLSPGNDFVVQANQQGLGLAAGDLHAAQGDGELGGTGIETAGRITLRVNLMAHEGRLPLIVTPTNTYVLASSSTLDSAITDAFSEGVDLVARRHQLSWEEAYRLASVIGNIEISQVVNALKTVRFAIPSEWSGLSS